MDGYNLVPFDPEWAKTLPDVPAVYLRPRRDKWERPIREADGTPAYDVMPGLPLARHHDHVAKGFIYLTLATNEALRRMEPSLRARGLNPMDFLNGPFRRVWEPDLYLEAAAAQRTKDVSELTALVDEFGAEAVTAIKRQTDPGFELPTPLQHRKAKGAAK